MGATLAEIHSQDLLADPTRPVLAGVEHDESQPYHYLQTEKCNCGKPATYHSGHYHLNNRCLIPVLAGHCCKGHQPSGSPDKGCWFGGGCCGPWKPEYGICVEVTKYSPSPK